MKILLNWMPEFACDARKIDYRQKGLSRKPSRIGTGPHIAPAPSLQQAIPRPGEPRQRGVDALVG
jgi:hypothetical protein